MDKNNSFTDPAQVKILVVDDEISMQKFVKRVLDGAGYTVSLASDGVEALECVEKSSYDLVITDIAMPRMDGIKLIEKMNNHFSEDVIVMTGRIDQYSYDQLIPLGASDFLKKPFTTEEMLLRVKRVLRERQLNKEVIRFHEELSESQKLESIGQLAAGIAHEINTPIQYIGDNTSFLKEAFGDLTGVVEQFTALLEAAEAGKIDDRIIEKTKAVFNEADVEYLKEEVPSAVKQTLEGIERVSKIVRSMKEFSHPGGEEKTITDIHHSIKNTMTVTRNEWKYIADFVLDLAPDLPMVNCNAGEMNQVFLNMIINAVHAISDKVETKKIAKGTIRVSTKKKDNSVEIRISDNGAGIPREIVKKVFDPFFTTKEIGKGTGQGLSISRSVVVDKHNGELNVETKEGEGTSFIIKLPIN